MAAPDLKVWLITGVNAGLGLTLATIAARAGHTVIGTVRSAFKFPASLGSLGVHPLVLTLTEPESAITSAIESITAQHGRLDVLVNNAGYAHLGSLEESTDEDAKAQFEINVFAVLKMIRGALPTMRSQGSGVIVNMSSIAGVVGGPGAGMYVASKFALEGLSESLREEVKGFGIRVHIVEPGYFRTNFLGIQGGGASNLSRRNEAYPDVNKLYGERHGQQNGDPEKGMQRVYELITLTGMCTGFKDQLRMVIGPDGFNGAKVKAERFLKELEVTKDVAHTTDIEGAAQLSNFA